MSKHNNVNPGQYKVAGRERPGRDLVQDDHKAQYTTNRRLRRRSASATPNE
jgi:hypothetical protein